MRQFVSFVLIALFLAATVPSQAQQRAPIRYRVSVPAPQTNFLEVEATVPTDGRPSVELFMAVWTPGSYLIREYERNVENVKASAGGRDLAVEKPVKNRWRITTGGAREITVSYRVFSHEMTVRSNWVEADFAMINGAPTFMSLVGSVDRPHEVTLVLPPGWKGSWSGMPAARDGSPNHYLAADYDVLVDSPIVAGSPAVHTFTVDGRKHQLVDVGEAGVFEGEKAAKDLERIVEADKTLWGALPYDKYVFFNLLTESSGGLEHRNSVMMMATRWKMATRASYVDWLSLASHEYFHLWNVKRLRPVELGPFDYEKENYPRSLWVSEGLTDYYGDLQVRRAGLTSPSEYLALLSDAIRTLQTTPGRLAQSVAMASFDAWIKQYRPDENSVNSSISYYTKGAVIGFLLDARVRAASNGAKSLDDVMRAAFARYSGARGFTPEQFRQVASDVAGTDLSGWLQKVLETTEELEYGPALDWYGLEFARTPGVADPAAWLGAKTRTDGGRLIVDNVPRGTPAYDAGLNAGDEIVAIDDFRVLPEKFAERMHSYAPGQQVTLLIARREELKRLRVTLAAQPANTWQLAPRQDATPAQRAHLEAWLR